MEAGCRILCEKPIAHDLQDAEWMSQVAQKTGVLFMMGMNNRFRGNSRCGSATLSAPIWATPTTPSAGGSDGKAFRASADGSLPKRCPGGLLIDVGAHVLDLTWWLTGCPKPVAV